MLHTKSDFVSLEIPAWSKSDETRFGGAGRPGDRKVHVLVYRIDLVSTFGGTLFLRSALGALRIHDLYVDQNQGNPFQA